MAILRPFASLLIVLLSALLIQSTVTVIVAAAPLEDAQRAYSAGDYATALRVYRPLAERGNSKAREAIGRMYSLGEGVPVDKAEASIWFEMTNSDKAGLLAYGKADFVMALQIFRPLAERGQVLAEYFMGLMYANGQGLPQDYRKAMEWYRKSAEKGEAKAQFSLGVLYYKGLGTNTDPAEAFKWYLRASNQGDPIAQFNLGAMYAKGDGVQRDPVTADMWFILAATARVKAAEVAERELAKSMSPAQRAEALKRARAFVPRPEI